MRKEKVMPNSPDAEQAVLGAMLIDTAAVITALDKLKADDFYRQIHANTFTLLADMFNANIPVDYVTAVQEAQRRDLLKEWGGAGYLQTLVESCPVASHIEQYVKIIKAKATARALIVASEQTLARAYADEDAIEKQTDEAGQKFFEIGSTTAGEGGFKQVKSKTDEIFELLKSRIGNQTRVFGLPTGFHDLDTLTGGLHPGQMTVLAARPGVGKTALAMQIALNVATGGAAFGTERHEPKSVAFISLEMSTEMLLTRLLSQVSGVDGMDAQRGWIDAQQLQYLNTARLLVRSSPLFIDDAQGLTTFQMLARVRKVAAETKNLGLIVVDYLQLARTHGKAENRVQEISEIGRALFGMAKQFHCPVLALSQLSRAVEQREDKRPVLSDLRESGTIEQDAANVWFLYRPGYYHKMRGEEIEDKSVEISIAKQRNGPQGAVEAWFYNECARFASKAKGEYEQEI